MKMVVRGPDRKEWTGPRGAKGEHFGYGIIVRHRRHSTCLRRDRWRQDMMRTARMTEEQQAVRNIFNESSHICQ